MVVRSNGKEIKVCKICGEELDREDYYLSCTSDKCQRIEVREAAEAREKESVIRESVNRWHCGYCGRACETKEDADKCCADRVCKTCGVSIGKRDYYLMCDSCREIAAGEKEVNSFNKAEKLTIKEYSEKYPNYMVSIGDDCCDVDDIDSELEYYGLDRKQIHYMWGTYKFINTLDPEYIENNFVENVEVEDFYLDKQARLEINEFCEKWNEKHAETVFYKSNNVVVLLD